jgi:hypothetical protein
MIWTPSVKESSVASNSEQSIHVVPKAAWLMNLKNLKQYGRKCTSAHIYVTTEPQGHYLYAGPELTGEVRIKRTRKQVLTLPVTPGPSELSSNGIQQWGACANAKRGEFPSLHECPED